MYDEQDLERIRKSIGRIRLVMLLPACVLLILIVWSFIARIKWLSILLTCLAGIYLVYVTQEYLGPRKAYLKHVTSALRDERKVFTGIFTGRENAPVERNGVAYYAFCINVGSTRAPEDDRLFYYDALKPMPDWKEDQLLTVTSYDKFVISVQEATADA